MPQIAILFPISAVDCITNIPEPVTCVKKAIMSKNRKAFPINLTIFFPVEIPDCLILINVFSVSKIMMKYPLTSHICLFLQS